MQKKKKTYIYTYCFFFTCAKDGLRLNSGCLTLVKGVKFLFKIVLEV